MKASVGLENCISGRDSGLTLVEVVVAVALVALSAIMLYPSFMFANSMIMANQQRLEADALAMDKIMELFNTFDFQSVMLATNLPPSEPPASGLLPDNSEIRAMISPNMETDIPYKWDVEVRVKRDRFWAGGRKVTLTNDIVYRITRYNIDRN